MRALILPVVYSKPALLQAVNITDSIDTSQFLNYKNVFIIVKRQVLLTDKRRILPGISVVA